MNDKKKITIIILAVITFLITTIGLTFAYFTATVNGNESSETSVITTTATLGLIYETGNQIFNDKAVPGWSGTKIFTVTNTSPIALSYDIVWTDIINDFLRPEDVVYTLSGSNEKETTEFPYEDDFILDDISIDPQETHTYELTIKYLNKDFDQNDDQGKIIAGKIIVLEEFIKVEPFVVDFAYKAGNTVYTVEESGYYLVELWGNQGSKGGEPTYPGAAGKGGYVSGYTWFDEGDILNIYMGQGGAGGSRDMNNLYGGAGGGATDIRVLGTALANRIIVAGGGGGGAGNVAQASSNGNGGAGGATSATNGVLGNGSTAAYIDGIGGGAGGGGGGWHGGSAGWRGTNAYCAFGTAGGGGSSHATDRFERITYTHGINAANGKAKLSYVGTRLPKE